MGEHSSSLLLSKWPPWGSGKKAHLGPDSRVCKEAASTTRLLVGLSFHGLTPTPWIGRHGEAADGLHSVQETITALMCQTNGRREKIGVGKAGLGWRALHSSGS